MYNWAAQRPKPKPKPHAGTPQKLVDGLFAPWFLLASVLWMGPEMKHQLGSKQSVLQIDKNRQPSSRTPAIAG